MSSEAQRFLTILDPSAEEFDYRFIFPSSKKDALPAGAKLAINLRSSVQLCDFAARDANAKGYGIFVVVNRTDGEGVKDKNIIDVRAVFTDFDDGIPAPERFALPPTMIVETSPGKAQYYWLVDDDMSPDQFKGIVARLVKDYGADANAKDLARVLRVPGFMHTKGEPTPVKLIFPKPDEPVTRYATHRLLKAFPPLQSEKKKAPPTIPANFSKVYGVAATRPSMQRK